MSALVESSGQLTVVVPERWVADRVGEIDGLKLVVWDLRGAPPVDRSDIDVVVLPYYDTGAVLPVLATLPRLRLVHTLSTGFDGVVEAVGPEVTVVTAAGVHAPATAEMALALLLGSLRGIDVAARHQAAGIWAHERRRSLLGRRVLMIGAGGIGEEIARRLDPFGVELLRVGTRARDDARGHVYADEDLPGLLPRAEVVVLVVPLTAATHHLVDAGFLAALPDGAVVVNVARGPVVDTDALLAEVSTGRLFAALDVVEPEPLPADHPLWRASNVLITPHEGGDSDVFEPRAGRLVADQLHALAEGRPLVNVVRPGR